MTDTGHLLSRRYRRWLRAYPRWYRRERGREMLTTLLDEADPGQTRPTRREIADIVGGGLRCRLRLARGLGDRAASFVAVLAAALAAAAGAGLLITGYLAPMPTEDEAMAIAHLATDRRAVNLPSPILRCLDYCVEDWTANGDQVASIDEVMDVPGMRNLAELMPPGAEPMQDNVTVVYRYPREDSPAVVPEARQRLAAAGWDVGEVGGDGATAFWASNEEWVLHVSTFTATTDASLPTYVILSRNFPSWGGPLIVACLLVGLLGGWPAVSWITQRAKRHHPAIKPLITLIGVPVLMVIVLVLCGMALTIPFMLVGGPTTMHLLMPAAVVSLLSGFPGVLPVIAAATAIIFVLAALPLRSAPAGCPSRKDL